MTQVWRLAATLVKSWLPQVLKEYMLAKMQGYKMKWDLGDTLSFTWWCEIAELCHCSGNDWSLAQCTWQGDRSVDPPCSATVLWWWGHGHRTTSLLPSFLPWLLPHKVQSLGWILFYPGESVSSRRFFWLVWHIAVSYDKGVLVAQTQEPFLASATKLADMAWDMCQHIHW